MVLPVLCTEHKEGASKRDAAVLVSGLVNEVVPGYIKVVQTRTLQLDTGIPRSYSDFFYFMFCIKSAFPAIYSLIL